MNKYIIIAVCLFILNGCFNNSDKMNATEKKTTVDSVFPVTSYLKVRIIIL